MRIRRKKWARPELAVCPYYIRDAAEQRGKWNTLFPDGKLLYAELGCGKGTFAARAALRYPEINWLAVDIKDDMLGVARRTIEKAFTEAGREVSNLKLVSCNVERISECFSGADRIDRLYINFCNPWPKTGHQKRRLTHTRQLEQYKIFLPIGGEIHFKTDDDGLFEDSLRYFSTAGYTVKYLTHDLHNSDYPDNIVTEHEKMFSDEGKTIKFLIAVNGQRTENSQPQ